jgi:hypothetical protein
MYLIGGLSAFFNVILTAVVAYCLYLAFADSPYYIFVAAGIFLTDCVLFMLTTAAFTEMKNQ